MKQSSILLISFLTALSINAQENISAVTISVNSTRTPQITVDGREYNLNNSTTADNKTTISLNNLQAGQHSLQVTRSNQNMNRSDRISTVFNLRPGYDMLIKVNRNGSLELIETKKAGISYNRSPMREADFNTLLKNVRAQRSINGRRSAIANAFNTTNNYFSTSQVMQLLQLVNSENFRLELAKSSYRLITDQNNFNQVYDLLNDQSSINELEDYAANYDEDEDTNNSTTGKVAMTDADFNSLYRSIQQQWPASTQMNTLTNAFNNSNNYFTTYQARQLIQIAGTESNRLQLAKLSYRRITDPVNFSQMYNLFNNQSSRDELAAYVNNNFNTGSNSNVAMSDANFNNLYQSIQQQWPASTQMNSLTNAFNNSNNYFTTYQARQLIQIAGTESNKLQLAKLSYRSIIDPVNFSQMYNLFNNQSSRDELAAYVNNFNTGSNSNVAMPDASFNSLYQSIQLQFLPGEKMSSLVNVFNNTSNYFTSAQAKQLIQLVSSESNRLQLAKLAYRTITDRNNFSQLYDLLISQAARNELDAYVKAYKG
jgi:hypothetical protein